jgi:hypothetical protein
MHFLGRLDYDIEIVTRLRAKPRSRKSPRILVSAA